MKRSVGALSILLLSLLDLTAIGCNGSQAGSTPTTPTAPTQTAYYTAWGDSLTAGCEDGASPQCAYPYQLSQLISNSVVLNEGIGGQTSTQIAVRMGAVPTYVTSAFTIPASGSVSNVTFETGHEPCFNVAATGYIEGTIDGVQVYCQNPGGTSYTLTRVAAGAAQNVNSGDAWTPVLAATALNGINIIWAGRSNTSTCPTSAATTSNCPVASDIAAMTSYIIAHGGKYLVLTVINGELDGDAPYSTPYEWIMAINTWITSTYPNNSFDIREPLVAAYDASNPADVLDHANDIPPFSLRAFNSSGTLAAAVSSPTTCAISLGFSIGAKTTVTVGSEHIFIDSGTDGNYVCTRGYAGSTAATYSSGTPWIGTDPLHLSGYGTANAGNPNGPGYTFVAKAVQGALAKLQ